MALCETHQERPAIHQQEEVGQTLGKMDKSDQRPCKLKRY